MKRKNAKVHEIRQYDAKTYATALVIAYQKTIDMALTADLEDKAAIRAARTQYAICLKDLIRTYPELMEDALIKNAVEGR